MTHYVFVYGTLRSGETNHQLLVHAKRIAEQAWTSGQLYDTTSNYPAMVMSNEGVVYGELYEIDDSIQEQIDNLEGYHPDRTESLFNRSKTVVTTDTEHYHADVYTLNDVHRHLLNHPIKYGDWKVHRLLLGQYGPLYYYAYGSCMDHERFQKAGVDHFFQQNVGMGHLNGYSLKFTMKGPHGGAADIVEDGEGVEGIVYQVDKEAIDYLFVREGVEAGWYRPAVISVEVNDHQLAHVLTFIVINKADESLPSTLYASEILRGGHGTLSKNYLSRLQDRLNHQFNMDLKII